MRVKNEAAKLLGAVTRTPTASRNQRLPGGRYAFAALAALSATALNSAPVQALAVVTWEIAPAAATAINPAMVDSASSVSRNEQEVGVAGREVKVDKFAPGRLNHLPCSRFSILRCGQQPLDVIGCEPSTRNQSYHGCLPLRAIQKKGRQNHGLVWGTRPPFGPCGDTTAIESGDDIDLCQLARPENLSATKQATSRPAYI
jgi:hypothetical protein